MIDMRSNAAWLTGLVSTMDDVTRGGPCTPIDSALRDRFAAHLRLPKPVARVPLAPIDEEAPTWRYEDVEH